MFRVIGSLAFLTAAGCTALMSGHAASSARSVQTAKAGTSQPPFQVSHGPFLQAPSESGITVSWTTTRKAVSWVEYRRTGSDRWQTNYPTHHGLVDADVVQHNVPIPGLEAGTSYEYRAVSREVLYFRPYSIKYGETTVSAAHTFTTLDSRKPSFSFVAVNDRHENAPHLKASWASVDWRHVDLAFLNGDMVSSVQSEQQLFRAVIDPCAEAFARSTPFVYVRGNHDTRGNFARHLLEFFPTGSGRFYYTMKHGPVLFIVLDCGEDKADTHPEYSGLAAFKAYMEEQARWLEAKVQDNAFQQATYRIALIHIPPSSVEDDTFVESRWIWEHMGPLLNQAKIDLMLCGHTHDDTFQPAGTDGINFPIVIGGAESVLRCDVSPELIHIARTTLSGAPLPQLPPIRARAQ